MRKSAYLMVVLIITTLTWKPTSSQATDQSCRDGDRIKMGSRFEECSYVKQKMRFCTWPKIKIHCAKSCGQCGDPSLCLDSTEAFRLIEEGVITSCEKIKDDTGNLCNNVIVKNKCPVSCNNCPCVDTTKPVWVNRVKRGQSCENIAENLVYCEEIQAQTKCPQTCNTCSQKFGCMDKSGATWGFLTCEMVKKRVDKVAICKVKEVRRHCQKTCTNCSNAPSSQPETSSPSQPPTDQPTRLPSQHPIDQPSNHPTDQPTRLPSQHPIDQPSNHPTDQPTHSSLPTSHP